MSESRQTEITIGEISFEHLEKIVMSCYGQIDIQEASELLHLLESAEKYQMKTLTKDCIALLSQFHLPALESKIREWIPFLENYIWKPTGNKEILTFLVRHWRAFFYFPEEMEFVTNHLSHFNELLPS